MAELDLRISGDWIELKGKSNDLHALIDMLDIPSYELKGAAEMLRHSVEQGIVEYKRALLMPVLVALETARYKSLAGQEMTTHEKSLAVLLLAILLQRLLCTEVLPLSREPEEKRSFGVESMQVDAILADVNARLKRNPALRSHAAIKNILMQMQRYNAENKKMRALMPTIKPEMRKSFLTNFARTFEEIIGSIRRHYATILQEQADADKGSRGEFTWTLLPLKELAPLLASQAREVSRIRSTLAHARDEKYKTREVLVRLYDGRQAVLKLIEEELKVYRRICQQALQYDLDACSLALATGFRDEVVAILDKKSRREEPA